MTSTPTLFGLPRLFWVEWVTSFVGSAGRFVIPFMSSYLTIEQGLSPAAAGVIVSFYGVGGIASALFGAFLSDRFGRVPVIVTGYLLSAGALVSVPFLQTPFWLAASLLLFGITSNVALPALAALIADIVPPKSQARAYMLHTWGLNLGFIVGPLLAAAILAHGFAPMFWIEAATLVSVAAVLGFTIGPAVKRSKHAGLSSGPVRAVEAYKQVATDWLFLGLVGLVLIYTSVYFQSTSSLPVAMHQQGLPPQTFALLLSMNGVLLCLLQVPMIRVLEKLPKAVTLGVALVVTALGFAVLANAHTEWQYAIATAIWSIGELGTFPIAAALASSLAPARLRGTYQGFYNLTWSGGLALAPVAGGFVLSATNATTLWWLCTGALVLGGLGFLVGRSRFRRREETSDVATDAGRVSATAP
ncbi:MFS transporter [Microbacterium panaciterrae]|uniref:MFS transporter n=1 Tax=Microbacterium panaciterrae TaxID=985759 RepID=A0ABP8PSB4_9MICO